MPYECAESSHAVEHRSRATCASGTPTLMLVTAIMPLLAAHRFFLVSVHASAAKRVRLRDAVRRVAAASMAGMVLRALRQPCDRRAGSAGFRGRKNAAFVRSGTNAARAAVPSWRREAPGSKNPQPLRRGARRIDARPGLPAGHRRRRGAGGLSDTAVSRTVHANGVAPVWPGGVASIASRVVASRYTPLLIWPSDAWSRR